MNHRDRSKWRNKLRDRIEPSALIDDLLDIAAILHEKQTSQDKPANKLHAVRVGALKAAADIKLRLLAKVLPDIKAVENDIGEHALDVSDKELDERIRRISNELENRAATAARGESTTIQ